MDSKIELVFQKNKDIKSDKKILGLGYHHLTPKEYQIHLKIIEERAELQKISFRGFRDFCFILSLIIPAFFSGCC
jgi:hypothetical protein